MGVYLGSVNLLGGSGGGGGLPETEIFTTDGTWTVPQSVIDEIASEGHAEANLFLVGGGSVSPSGNSGEIVSGLRQINGADYDPVKLTVTSAANIGDTTISISAAPKDMVGGVFTDGAQTRSITAGAPGATSITLDSGLTAAIGTGELRVTHTTQTNPVISVQVGGVGENSGFTLDPSVYVLNNIITTAGVLNRNVVTYYSFPANMAVNSDGYPLIQSITFGLGIFSPVPSASGFTISPSITAQSLTWPEPTVFDGTFTVSGNIFGDAGTFTWKVDGATAAARLANRRWYAYWSNAGSNMTFGNGNQEYQSTDAYLTEARHGDSGQHASFLNNSTSTDGYFGGFGRAGSTKANSGSPGQAGYVQIVF